MPEPDINPDHRYHKLWLLIGYALVSLVIYLSVTSKPPMPDVDLPYFDKIGHLSAYFVMMMWFAQLYHVKKLRLIYACSFIALGVVMEIVQSFDPERMAEFADMVANTAGVLFAYVITKIPVFRQILIKIETFI